MQHPVSPSRLPRLVRLVRPLVLGLGLAALASCAVTPAPPVSARDVPALRPGSDSLIGYLPPEALPRSDLFLPPAPQAQPAGSTDEVAARQAFQHRGSARWQLAARDANLRFPAAAESFACALGFEPTEAQTPNLYMLLRRTLTDAGRATYAAKNKFNRTRPFVELKQPSCTPAEEDFLSKDGSYPSGHAALGWAWALVLAELAPSRSDALFQRGYAFGQSRVRCGVHWQSDVDAGRTVGAATVAVLHRNPTFVRQAQLARAELEKALSQPAVTASPRCLAEQAALVD